MFLVKIINGLYIMITWILLLVLDMKWLLDVFSRLLHLSPYPCCETVVVSHSELWRENPGDFFSLPFLITLFTKFFFSFLLHYLPSYSLFPDVVWDSGGLICRVVENMLRTKFHDCIGYIYINRCALTPYIFAVMSMFGHDTYIHVTGRHYGIMPRNDRLTHVALWLADGVPYIGAPSLK